MPAAVGGYVLKDGLVTVEGTAYSNQCKTIMLTPSQDTQTYRTIVPDGTKQDVDTAVWSLTLAGLQDYEAARGLARLLTDNAGEKLDIVVTPDQDQGVSATVTVTAKAVPFGGDTGSWAEFSVELPVDGAPVFS
jgi:hypothetical protein